MKIEVLVIGSGGAGMRAALAAKEEGAHVCLVAKTFPTRNATAMAQGGMNGVVTAIADSGDKPERYEEDVIRGGSYLNDQEAVRFFARHSGEEICWLEEKGMPFSRDEKGHLAKRRFAGQSKERTYYCGDKTGNAMVQILWEQCVKEGITVIDDGMVLDIVEEDRQVQGVVLYRIKTGEIEIVEANTVIVATGGAGRMYGGRTTNPYGTTGDGIAACMRLGVAVKDMEMMQFHPTGLVHSGIVISEAVRGEGGHLLNRLGERFMARYAPEKMELATRDVVAKAIEMEIAAGRGFGEGMYQYVLADVRHLGKEKIMDKLSGVRDLARTYEHVDPIEQPIPIRPVCHYLMGGIKLSSYETGETTISGLYATGEAACVSVHGANRLGGNALTDILVFGKATGVAAAKRGKEEKEGRRKGLLEKKDQWQCRFAKVGAKKEGPLPSEIYQKLGLLMWQFAGLDRHEEGLKTAWKRLEALEKEYEQCRLGDEGKAWNQMFIAYVELGNMMMTAKATILGALERTESRGCHSRRDYCQQEAAVYHTEVWIQDGTYQVQRTPVSLVWYAPVQEG